jgi:hypothetical protein
LGVGLTTLSCKKEIVEKPPRNSAGFCGGDQGLRWAVEPRKEEEEEEECIYKKGDRIDYRNYGRISLLPITYKNVVQYPCLKFNSICERNYLGSSV